MCTLEKRGNLFILTLTGSDKQNQEHRLSPTLIASIRSALAEVKSQAADGSALVTRAEAKFFSNGLDLRHLQAVGARADSVDASMDELLHMVELSRGLLADLISLPMPTIAAVTGHAAAGGMILAIVHDYVAMTSGRGVMYMNELDIGLPLPDYIVALIREKVGSAAHRRRILLQAAKIKAEEAKAMGIVDSAHNSAEEVVDAAMQRAEELVKRRWSGKAYAELRKALYPETCAMLGLKVQKVLPSKL